MRELQLESAAQIARKKAPNQDMVWFPGGTFRIGSQPIDTSTSHVGFRCVTRGQNNIMNTMEGGIP